MNEIASTVPVVLALSGNDPSGGAGIQADIESLASHGCHCAPVITAITVQDTQTVFSYAPLDGTLIMEQARAVLEDMPVAAIKIGMLGSAEAVEAICGVLQDYPNIPVVLDPIIASGNGTNLAGPTYSKPSTVCCCRMSPYSRPIAWRRARSHPRRIISMPAPWPCWKKAANSCSSPARTKTPPP